MSIDAEPVGATNDFSQYPDVYHPFFEAGIPMGVEPDEIYKAMAPVDADGGEVEFEEHGVKVVSTRFHGLPIVDLDNPDAPDLPGKGGIMRGPRAVPGEIYDKDVLMGGKNILISVAGTGDGATGERDERIEDLELGGLETVAELIPMRGRYFAAAKGGMAHEEVDDPEIKDAIMRRHATEHDYGPDRPGGVGAPDEGTAAHEMQVAAEALEEDGYDMARASFTGLPKEFGGIPDFRWPATGKGGAIVAARGFEALASKDPALKRTMENAGIIGGIIIEGWGGAGHALGHHISRELPGVGVSAITERYWALIRKNGGFINPLDVDRLIEEGYLQGENPSLPKNSGYALVDKEEAWSQPAVIAAPAARSHTIDAHRVNSWNGVIMELDIANNPNTSDSFQALKDRQIIHVVGSIANAGGVTASGFEFANAMAALGGPDVGWDPKGFENSWYQSLSTTASLLFRAAMAERTGGEALPIADVTNKLIVARHVRNLRILERLGRIKD